tara:strand:- start:828 stop:1061 length:234 start_codon:yes stop_codon:yes gene_type:complete
MKKYTSKHKEHAVIKKLLATVLISEVEYLNKYKEVCRTICFITKIPEKLAPKKGECLLQDYWKVAGVPYVAEECDVV